MKWMFIALFLCIAMPLIAITETDSLVVDSLHKKVVHYLPKNLDTALLYIRKGISYCSDKNLVTSEAIFTTQLGTYYLSRSKLDSARLYYQQSIDKAGTDNLRIQANVFNNLGIIDRRQGKMEAARKNYMKSLEAEKQMQNLKGQLEIYGNIAVTHEMQGNYEQAIHILYTSLQTIDSLSKDSLNELKARFYSNIGTIYFQLSDQEEALSFYKKAYLTIPKGENLFDELLYLTNIETTLLSQEKLDSIPFHLNQIDSLAQRLKHPYFLAKFNLDYCLYFIKIDNYEQAIIYADKTGLLLDQNGDFGLRHYLESYYAKIAEAKGDLEIAIEHYYAAMNIADELEDISFVREKHRELAHSLELKGNQVLALQHLNSYLHLNDSLNKIEFVNMNKSLRIKHNIALLKKDIKLKESIIQQQVAEGEIATQKSRALFWILALLSIILLSSVFFTVILRRQKLSITRQNSLLSEKNELIATYQEKYIKTLERSLSVSNIFGKRETIDLRDIIYLERGDGQDVGKNSLKIYTSLGKSYHKKISVKAILEELKDTSFVKVSPGMIINLHFVSSYQEKTQTITLQMRVENKENKRLEHQALSFTLPKSGRIVEGFVQTYQDFIKRQP